MAPVEPWERVWIDAEGFGDDVHSYINCTECHGGQAVEDFEMAHEGMNAEVVTDPISVCGRCHLDVAPVAANSLHNSLSGYDTAIYARSAPEFLDDIEHIQANHCDSCHADCGDCHVSQPTSVGGGLLEGHVFVQTPSMSRNCTACHGSRVKNEYYGAHEDISADVHFKARMACTECHTGDEMHGFDMEDVNHRYDGAAMPACEDCHEGILTPDSDIRAHAWHEEGDMSCQVCHSTTYQNCVNCHVQQSEEGIPFFTVEENFLAFYIGLNPNPTEERPYKYVPVRHVPIDRESFSFYGDGLLPNYDARPTWVMATPHNIQRITPQAERCGTCHGNNDVFLTPDKVDEDELEANHDVIVEEAPAILGARN